MDEDKSAKTLTKLLDVQYPIIQAPMAGTATPELVAAVSNAGAIGSLAIGAATVEQARNMIARTRELTNRTFNVNVFCHQTPERDMKREAEWLEYLAPYFDEFGSEIPEEIEFIDSSILANDAMLQMLLEEKPAIVSFHFGFPSAGAIQALKSTGITTFATATSLEEARAIEAAGIDAIVAQGVEAGGHRGIFDTGADDQRLPTSVLVRTLVEKQDLPVIAAGGIMDGRSIQAVLNLGASAAQLGTAFVLCPESAANDVYRSVLKSDRASRTMHTTALTGRPARGIVNTLTELGQDPSCPKPPEYPLATSVSRAISAVALQAGSIEFGSYWAGQAAPLAREMPAGELVALLVQEMSEA